MIFEIANDKVTVQDNKYGLVATTSDEDYNFEHFSFFGNYKLSITHVDDDGDGGESIVKWNNEHKKKEACPRYKLHPDLLRVLYRESKAKNLSNCVISGATEMKMICAGVHCIFRAHPWFRGKPWHDGAYVEYVHADSR